MTLGTGDKKKVGALCGLGLLAVYLVYTNVLAGPPTTVPTGTRAGSPTESVRSAAPVVPDAGIPGPAPTTQRAPMAKGRGEEFHPVLHPKRKEDRIDPFSVDPTLRLDLLAKMQGVQAAGGERNLFQFVVKAAELKGPEPQVAPFVGPVQPPPPAAPPPPAPPPPIELKYFGFSTARDNGRKTAFFLDGEEIIPAMEGQTVKKRYRVVSIGVNSVVLEDLDLKQQRRLPLAEEAQG